MSSVSHKLRRFAALEPVRRARLLTAMMAASFVRLSIRRRGYAGTRELLRRWTPDSPPALAPSREAEIVELDAWAIRATGEQMSGATCLVRSLTLWWLLARRGIRSEIQFGVQKAAADLEAHAWLEWNGRPVTDADDPRERFSRLEGTERS